jgi:hypothetical protein
MFTHAEQRARQRRQELGLDEELAHEIDQQIPGLCGVDLDDGGRL